ncbi:MAG: CoA-binding protein [Polyangiaceae bacterium]
MIDGFLAGRRIAVVGVSRNPQDFSRALLREMRDKGYEMVPVRPDLDEVDFLKAYPRVQDIQGRLDGVIVMTSAEAAKQVVKDCAEARVKRVWLYQAAGAGAVSEEAVSFCRDHDIEVVPGECPLMFLGGSVHDMHRSIRKMTDTLPVRGAERATANKITRAVLFGLVALELFNAIGAFYGGGSMILDPNGRPMGMSPPAEMPGLRFASYLVPGVVLLIANGLLPTIVVIGALTKQRWSVRGHLFAGLVLTGWTVVEVMMLGWISFLQPLMLSVGIALLALGWLYKARFDGARRHLPVTAQ